MVFTGIRLLLLIHLFIFSFIFLSNFHTLQFFITLFWRTVRSWRLKLGTHMDTGQMYRVYRNHAAAAYLSLSFFIFLSLQFSNNNIFVILFSGTVRPWMLKLGTHVDSGQMYRVTQNQAAALIRPFISSFFFLSNFQTLQVFVTLFSGTVRSCRLKFGTHLDSGQMYLVYRNHFLHFSFSQFSSHFSQELWGLEGWNLVHTWLVGRCIVYIGIRLLLQVLLKGMH